MSAPLDAKHVVIFYPAEMRATDAQGKSYTEPLTGEMQGDAMMYTLSVCKAHVTKPYAFAHCMSAALCRVGIIAIMRSIPELRGPMEVVYSTSQINGKTGELEHIFNVMCAFVRVATFTASLPDDKIVSYPMTPTTR